MHKILTNLVSFFLPITVLILVPDLLTDFEPVKISYWAIPGALLILIGLSILVITVMEFIRKGEGTLAPWSPTQKLVITGLHAYVRNPMILGVATTLCGEALILYSIEILFWLVLFIIINHFYFIYFEEPSLLDRFGKDYALYKKNVRRWIPQLHPYKRES